MLEMRRHCDQLTHGNDTCATHASYQEIVAILDWRKLGVRKSSDFLFEVVVCIKTITPLDCAAFDRDKTRAKTINAGKIFVAGILVDLALAAERCFLWDYRQTVGLYRAVAASLTNQVVDDNSLVRVLC